MVMSKDQAAVKRDAAIDAEMSSTLVNPAASVDVDDDGDDDDDETRDAAGMQFATETIVRNFSRCVSGSSMYDRLTVDR